VRKWDGRLEDFDREKVARTLRRMGVEGKQLWEAVDVVEAQAYQGIPTKKVLRLIYAEAEKRTPVKRRDLRAALVAIGSKPGFEVFVQRLLQGMGYRVWGNQVIQGYCVTHEIDGVAEKDGRLYYVESKHHSKPHIYTPFIDSLAVKAKMDDINRGYQEGRNQYDFSGAILICNTRLTQHAREYAKCVGIQHLGWNSPKGKGLEHQVEATGVYPFTMVEGLSRREVSRLLEMGVVTLRNLAEHDLPGIEPDRAGELREAAQKILA